MYEILTFRHFEMCVISLTTKFSKNSWGSWVQMSICQAAGLCMYNNKFYHPRIFGNDFGDTKKLSTRCNTLFL